MRARWISDVNALIQRKCEGVLIQFCPWGGMCSFLHESLISAGRAEEAGARGHQNFHTWVTVSSTAINEAHTCAMNSIVSGYFLLGTCPRRPQLHCWGTFASYGTPVKSNRMLVKVRPKGTRLNYLPDPTDCPSGPAWVRYPVCSKGTCNGWRITGRPYPGGTTLWQPQQL